MKKKCYIFALTAGIVAVISFVVLIMIEKNVHFTPWVKGRAFAFPYACLIAGIVALYVGKVWDKDD